MGKEEQLRYATVLHFSTLAGFVILLLTFFLYIFNVLPPHVPLERLPRLWGHSSAEYLRLTGMPTGWGWIDLIRQGDIASFLGIAVLSACSIICTVAVFPVYFRRGEKIYVLISLLQLCVLLYAASGVS